MKYIDNDPRLQPYTYYQYMLTAHNTVGQVSSPWAEVRTAAAPPSGFSAPLVKVGTCEAKGEGGVKMRVTDEDIGKSV